MRMKTTGATPMATIELTPAQQAEAEALFAHKWPVVQRIADFKCFSRRLYPEDRADVLQTAAMCLWVACQKAVSGDNGFRVNCRIPAQQAFSLWARDRQRCPLREADLPDDCNGDGDHDRPVDRAIPPPGIDVVEDGVRIRLMETDVRLDAPELVEVFHNGVSAAEHARQTGMTRQAIQSRCRARNSGGFFFGGLKPRGRWLFPPNGGGVVGAAL